MSITGPNENTYQIPGLSYSNTFNVWKDITDYSSYKLNKLKVYSGVSSANISASTCSTEGVLSVTLMPIVTTGHTFSGVFVSSGGATFTSTTDHAGVARFAAGVTTSALDVTGVARFAGGATFASTVAVVGGATFASTTDHTGAARFASTVAVLGGATFASTVAVVGGATFASTTDHTGAARFASTVAVVGGATFTSTTDHVGIARFAAGITTSALDVTGAARFASGATFASTTDHVGIARFASGATFTSTTDHVGIARFAAGITTSALDVTGAARFAGGATFASTVAVVGGLSASSLYASTGSTFASTVTVSGGATFASTTDHTGAARFAAGITTSALDVTGAARFAGGATFASTVAVVGGLSATALYASTGSTFASTITVVGGATFTSTTDHIGIARFAAGITTSALDVTGAARFAGGATFASGVNIGLGTSGATLGISGGVHLYAQSQLRFADSDSSNWVGFKSPATVANNVVWTLPGTTGSANQLLTVSGDSGTLSWTTPSSGVAGLDTQIQYNASSGLSASSVATMTPTGISVGTLYISNGATFASTDHTGVARFAVGVTTSALDVTGVARFAVGVTTSALDVTGVARFAGGATFTSTTDHTGVARFAAGVTTSALDVTGAARFAVGVTTSALDVTGVARFAGGATFASTDHTGVARFAAGVTTSALDVTGAARFASTVVVLGGLSASALYALTGSTFASTVTVSGGATFASTDHTGVARFAAGVTTSALDVTGAARFAAGVTTSALDVTGVSKFSGGVTFTSGVNIGLGTSGATLGISGGIHLYAQSQLRFADADSSNWVGFKSPATVANNVVWTLPGTTGSANQVLQLYDGSGGLTWASLQAGVAGSDTQIQYNASGGLSASSVATMTPTGISVGTLYISNGATFASTVAVVGGLSASALYASTGSTFASTVAVLGGATFASTDHTGAARFASTVAVVGGLSASALYASTGSTFAGTLQVSGGATFGGTTDHTGVARFAGGASFANNIFLNTQKSLQFGDSDSSHYLAFKAPATVTTNITWTLPATDGSNGQVLSTDGGATLSWKAADGVTGSDKQVQFNKSGAPSATAGFVFEYATATGVCADTLGLSGGLYCNNNVAIGLTQGAITARLYGTASTAKLEVRGDIRIPSHGFFVNKGMTLPASTEITIAADENAFVGGRLSIPTGSTLTINTNGLLIIL